MINKIIVCLFFTSLLLFVLNFWRNSRASRFKKSIISAILAAFVVSGIMSNADVIRTDINNAKIAAGETAGNVKKAVAEKTASMFENGKNMLTGTAESIQIKSTDILRAIITGEKAEKDESKDDKDDKDEKGEVEVSKEESTDKSKDKEDKEIKEGDKTTEEDDKKSVSDDDSKANQEMPADMTEEEKTKYNQLVQLGLTEAEAVDMINDMRSLKND